MKFCKDCENLKGSYCVRSNLPISPVTGKPCRVTPTTQRMGYRSIGYFAYGEYVGYCGMEAKYFIEKVIVEPIIEDEYDSQEII